MRAVGTILRDRRGYSLSELILVLVVISVASAIAIPAIRGEAYRVNAAVRAVSSQLAQAQRMAVSLQHNVVVALDSTAGVLRLHEDANNNTVIDGGERVTAMPLEDGVTFGRGTAGAHAIGAGTITFTRSQGGIPAVIFRRDGSASEYGGFYLITRKSRAAGDAIDARACEIVRATGRINWYRYTGSLWERGN